MEIKEVFEVLESISRTSSRLEKEKILKENGSEELKYLLKLALDPYILFGVKDFTPQVTNYEFPVELSFYGIQCLAEELISGKIVGNLAKEKLEDDLSCNNPLQVKYLTAVFKKDFRIGIDVKTVNKIFPKLIPTFDVGLCAQFDGKYFDQVKYWGIQKKLDGLRSVCIIDNFGEVEVYSRTGKSQAGFGHIIAEIKKLGLKNLVLDGEGKAEDWNETAAIMRSDINIKDNSNLKYYVFDCLTLEEWQTKNTRTYYTRFKELKDLLGFEDLKYIKIVDLIPINDLEEGYSYFEKFFAEGYEGAVLKNLESQYPFKRSRDWMKLKNEETYDLEIKEFVEGEGRNIGRLGKFICDFDGIRVGVGGGFSDKQREEFWQNKEQMVGKIIEIKAQEKTKDGSLRFPIFVRLREDK